jgi:glucose-6-phosphate isomerase
MEYKIEENKLIYKKDEYLLAVDWIKTFDDGKYAYRDKIKDQEIIYFGARYIEKNPDEQTFIMSDLMADVTVLKPGKIGEEFIKTVGHYHQKKLGLTIAYPEVYEALTGNIEYLLQSELNKEGKVDVLWVIAEAGDKVVMPPNWGHVSMNVGNKPAVEVDLQKRDNPSGSVYSIFRERVGGAFYRTKKGLEKNPNYEVASLRVVRPIEKPDWGLEKDKPLYTSFTESPEKFNYLINPEKYDFSLNGLFADIEL